MKVADFAIVLVALRIRDCTAAEPITYVSLISRNSACGCKSIFWRIDGNLVYLGMRLEEQFANLLLHRARCPFALDVKNDVPVLVDQIPIRPNIGVIFTPYRTLRSATTGQGKRKRFAASRTLSALYPIANSP